MTIPGLLCYFFSVFIFVDIASTRNLTPEQIEQLESFTEAVTTCNQNPGIGLALVRDGETVYTNGMGYRDNDNQLPMTADTRIITSSLTKSLTAVLLSNAVEQGLIAWSTPVQDVLGPEFELETEFQTKATLKDCFGHRIGLGTFWGVSTSALNFTREELCMRRLRYFESRRIFRNRPGYANYPLVLAGYVLEVLTGKTWEENIVEIIFQPLGMTDTRLTADMTEEDWDTTAYSHIYVDGEYIQNPEKDQIIFLTEIGPAAGLISTANDMAKYLKFFVSDGQNEAGEQVVPPAAVRNVRNVVMYTSGASIPVKRPQFPVDDMRMAYASGLWSGMYRGYEKNDHTGHASAYHCRISMLPEAALGVWTCVNGPGDDRGYDSNYLINLFAMDLLLDEEPWLNDTTGCTFPDPWSATYDREHDEPHKVNKANKPNESPIQDRPLEEYEGTYLNLGFDTFTIYINTTTGTLYYRHGRLLNGELLPAEEGDEFYMIVHYPLTYMHWQNPDYLDGFPLYFGANGDDEVVSVTVEYLDFQLPPVFEKET